MTDQQVALDRPEVVAGLAFAVFVDHVPNVDAALAVILNSNAPIFHNNLKWGDKWGIASTYLKDETYYNDESKMKAVLEDLLLALLPRLSQALAAHDRDHPERPSAPFAVNQIVHKSNNRLDEDMAVCAKWQVPMVITSLGAREDVFSAVRGWGGITLHDIIDDRFARKAIEKGADGLIPVAAGAGGHAGTLSPFALMQEIREWFEGPVALSGAIAHGRSILAAQALGADFAYVGSAFIATREANAAKGYKQGIVDGRERRERILPQHAGSSGRPV